MTTPDRTHGGLVESMLESVGTWLRSAAASVKTAATEKDRGRPLVGAELHDAAAYRYEEAALEAERLAEACRIQATYHKEMARVCRGDATPADDRR